MSKNEIPATEFKTFEATPTQIAQWKKEYGDDNILKLTINPAQKDTKLNPAVCFVRKPTLTEMIMAEQTGQNSILQEGEILLQACWLGGDEIIKTSPEYTLQACYKAHGLIEKMVSTLEKV